MSATKKVPASSSLQVLTTDALANALSKVGPSPCDKYACTMRQRCGKEELACHSFVYYLQCGKTVPPRTLFVDDRPVVSDTRYVQCGRVSATHTNYLIAFSQ